MRPNSLRHLAFGALIFSMSPSSPADSVKLIAKPAFDNVLIRDFRDGVLSFRGISGQVLRKPIEQVEWIALETFPELTRAEQLAAAGNPKADAAYEQARASAPQRWLRDLVEVRRIQGLDRGGLYDQAVAAWLVRVQRQPSLAGRVRPRNPPPEGSPVLAEALKLLENAYNDPTWDRGHREVGQLLLELSHYQGVMISATRADAASAGTAPGTRRRGLFAGVDEDAPATAARRLDAIPLAADSWLLAAARQATESGDPARGARIIRAAMPHVLSGERDPWRLELGRALLELGCPAEALEVLGQRSIRQETPLSAEMRYHEGLAFEQLGEDEQARTAFQDVLSLALVSPEIYERAAEAWNRLR